MVDKNLFLYDLAVVAIMKNEEPYVKEWIDYHLLAGVDHFFIYDNESTPEFKKILQPYIDADIVTYTFSKGRHPQIEAFNDAIQRFRFNYRYMAFMDGDEFIFPKSDKSITEVLDEIFSVNPNSGALLLNWQWFGSDGQEKADYSRGVLERFTRRAPEDWIVKPEDSPTKFWVGNLHVKTVTNPRKIDFISSPHYANPFLGADTVDENGNIIAPLYIKLPVTYKKIVINHYVCKSYEEFVARRKGDKLFNLYDRNEVFDDGILKYRAARQAATGGGIESLLAAKQINFPRLFNALAQNLFMTTAGGMPRNFYDGKIENFLTCLNLSGYLRGKVFDDDNAKIFEELSLNALYKSLLARVSIADLLLLTNELPNILELNYPAVKKIRELLIEVFTKFIGTLDSYNHRQDFWQKMTTWEYTLKLLKKFK